ncbi:unnamed protein product [Sphagnum tenellum]
MSLSTWNPSPGDSRMSEFPTPCYQPFAPKYKNIHGGWVSSSRQIQTTTAPKLPSDDDERKSALRLDKRPNIAEGGIYDKGSLDALEEYQDFSRAQAGIAATLVQQTIHSTGYRTGGPLRPGDMFGDFLKLTRSQDYGQQS